MSEAEGPMSSLSEGFFCYSPTIVLTVIPTNVSRVGAQRSISFSTSCVYIISTSCAGRSHHAKVSTSSSIVTLLQGNTPLIVAASGGRTGCLHFLLEGGVDPNGGNAAGDMPLHAAVRGLHDGAKTRVTSRFSTNPSEF